ncbi:response regulator [Novosphingobium jiangmenense]|uniref:response regulator n=1 Tax=Novosphingobium jiangmenense TaxID=2791981 RepID=UPI0031B5AB18
MPSTQQVGKSARKRKALRTLGPALVVEDDGLVAMDIAEALQEAGAEPVVICASVAEAMVQLEIAVPSLLVLDVHLADRDDGWALAELAIQLGESPPLIVFTTATPSSIPASAADLGHVLAKPFQTEALIALIEKERPAGLFGRIRHALSGQ